MAKIIKNLPLAIATVALGIIVGLSSLLVSVALDLTEKLFLHFQESNLVPVDVSAGGMRRFTSVLVGGSSPPSSGISSSATISRSSWGRPSTANACPWSRP